MSNRLYNAAIFNEAVYRPMKLITKPVVVIAGILLAALLLAPTFSVSAQTARSYTYNENGTAAIDTFRASTAVTWSLAGVDKDAFKISENGVLTFRKSPNYEKPIDVEKEAVNLNPDDDSDTDDPFEEADDAGNNVYYVYIVADTKTKTTTLVRATVTVRDVDDAGKVKLSHLQPAEGVAYTATVTDEDDGYRDAKNRLYVDFSTDNDPANDNEGTEATNRNTAELARWKWERSQSGTSGWAVIAKADENSYSPKAEDVGYYLRVTATYSDRDLYRADTTAAALPTDPVANAKTRTAVKRSDYPVKAENNTNQPPVFADEPAQTPDDDNDTQQTRDVNENDSKALVGAPVSASDPGDVLYYKLSVTAAYLDEAAETANTLVDPLPSHFNIDAATGQISVKDKLDHETVFKYRVTVTATDPFGSSDDVIVTITVNDEPEAPKITAGTIRAWVTENSRPVDGDGNVTGAAPLVLTDPDDSTNTVVDVYAATDPDQVLVDGTLGNEPFKWSLVGPDKKAFVLAYNRDDPNNPDPTNADNTDDTVTSGSVRLRFDRDTKVNFEKKDFYSVTVVAKDNRGLSSTRDVNIRVIDAEDGGKIKLSTRQAQVGKLITATLTDEDGETGSIMWRWSVGAADGDNDAGWTCPSTSYSPIDHDRARRATFTPTDLEVEVSATNDTFVARCLQVEAAYTDGKNH